MGSVFLDFSMQSCPKWSPGKPSNNDQIIEQITEREDFLLDLQIQNG